MPIKPIRDGFHTITPHLFAEGAPRLIDFIRAAFGGDVTFRKERPDGSVMHAEMRVGDSMVMLGDAAKPGKPGGLPAGPLLHNPLPGRHENENVNCAPMRVRLAFAA